jgi:hypothetical protein
MFSYNLLCLFHIAHTALCLLSGQLRKDGETVMRTQLFGPAIATTIVFFAQINSPAMAQAGSTGGTIGKQDKSVSGGEEEVGPKTRAHKSASRVVADKPKSSGCGGAVGTYKWYGGSTTTINANGTTTNYANRGNWTCANGQITINWISGHVDRLTPVSGGYSVVDNVVGQFSAVRM